MKYARILYSPAIEAKEIVRIRFSAGYSVSYIVALIRSVMYRRKSETPPVLSNGKFTRPERVQVSSLGDGSRGAVFKSLKFIARVG